MPRFRLPRLIQFARIHKPDAQGRVEIAKRNIYILPTQFGVLFGLFIIMVLIGAINYANNPAFLLAFLMTGIGTAAILQTWRNLTGLRLRWLSAEPAFAGDHARFLLRLENDRRQPRPALQLDLADAEECVDDLAGSGSVDRQLLVRTQTRGRLPAGRLVISTRYPLGLLRAWCYVDSGLESLVYPRPSAAWQPPLLPNRQGRDEGDQGEGTDDFSGLRPYRPGDSPRHVDWKALAAERGLLTKQFGGENCDRLWLDLAQAPGRDLEDQLSHLCRAVLDAEHQHQLYGLRLGDTVIPPGLGPVQRQHCLEALARYEETP